MRVRNSKNLEMLTVVAKGLKGLRERVVFVGGATIDLHLDPGAPEARATDDVDCVIELGTRVKYHQLEEELRGLRFQHPMAEKGPICRWVFCGIKVDVMPTEGAFLGFNNRWYRDGVTHARTFTLPDGQEIHAFSAPYMLASKLEAFHDRGHEDFLVSPDIEDVIALLNGCPDIEEKIRQAPVDARDYIVRQFAKLLPNEAFLLGLDGNLGAGPGGRERVTRCLEIMRRIARNK